MNSKPDTKVRCGWCGEDELYVHYHDTEWGVPVYDDHKLFEYLLLETFQAGLSWITVLRKRERFREVFDQFDFHKISVYDAIKVEELLVDAGIIRHRKKIEAAITNAGAFIKIRNDFGTFSNYIWQFVDNQVVKNSFHQLSELPGKTEIAEIISKDLKKRGFKFIGPTVVYAHMQATGMVNDHLITCFRYHEV
jgi:DNA-3-methyladenine glycosylase I